MSTRTTVYQAIKKYDTQLAQMLHGIDRRKKNRKGRMDLDKK